MRQHDAASAGKAIQPRMHCRRAADIIRQRSDPVSQPAFASERTANSAFGAPSLFQHPRLSLLQSLDILSIYISSYIDRRGIMACSDQTARARELEHFVFRDRARARQASEVEDRAGNQSTQLQHEENKQPVKLGRVQTQGWAVGRSAEIRSLSVRRTRRAQLQLGGKKT